MDAAQTTELWCHHQVSSWEGDACCRCSPLVGPEVALDVAIHHVQIIPREETGVPEDNPRWPTPVHPCGDNSGRMAWGYQGRTKSPMTIPQPLWYHDCRRWTYPKGRSSHHSTIGKGENTTSYTWRAHGNHQVPVPCKTMYIGLESMKTSGKWLKHAQHANITNHRNQDSHSNQQQHQNAHGNTLVLTTSHSMDSNTW